MRHITALNGIRGIAVLAVFAQHAGVPGTLGAGVGVDIFFVLSGFLITGLLLDEMARSDRIDIRAFYWRRFLRLTPALTLTLAAYAVVAPHDLGAVLIGAFYLTDYARAFFVAAGPLSHIWSLAVEEHFYLIWPIALLALCRLPRRALIPLLLALYVAATAHRGVASWMQGYDPTYFRFDTRLSGLILGSLLAVLLRSDWSRDKVTLGGIALGLGVAGGFALFSGQISLTLGIAVAEAAALRFILTAVEEKEPSALTRVLSLPALVYVGRISYGLYLFHHPLTFALHEEMGLHWTLVTALTLPASLAAAALSYHFIEQPILSRARASRAAVAAPDAAVHDVTVAPAFARRSRTAKRAHVARSGRDRVLSWRQARRFRLARDRLGRAAITRHWHSGARLPERSTAIDRWPSCRPQGRCVIGPGGFSSRTVRVAQ